LVKGAAETPQPPFVLISRLQSLDLAPEASPHAFDIAFDSRLFDGRR
jgi:hypothetical protein